MSAQRFLQKLSEQLQVSRTAGLGRTIWPVSARHGARVDIAGQEYLHFASNDFLGLGQDARMAERLATLCARQGSGAGASRLVMGTSASTIAAEQALARYFGYEACLIFGSGFLANLTLLATLFTASDCLMLDKRLHASAVAGVRHSGAAWHSFRHNDLSHLERLLQRHAATAVLTESLFSMDADSPDFSGLDQIKCNFDLLCIVDEAHAYGVLGKAGRGLAGGVADVAVGVLGKAFGLFGGFVLGPELVRETLVQSGQGLIYTTALPPWHGDMVQTMLEAVAAADDRRAYLADLGRAARNLLRDAGLVVQGEHHILALAVGNEQKSVRLSTALRNAGILVFAARYPTVPLGRAMLRVSLTSEHTMADIITLRDALVTAMKEL